MKWSFSYFLLGIFPGDVAECPMENVKGTGRPSLRVSFLQGGSAGELCEMLSNRVGPPEADPKLMSQWLLV